MVGLLQSSLLRALSSRLSQRIVAWIFLSIVIIELVILLPSYQTRRRELLYQLEDTSHQVLIAVKGNTMSNMDNNELLDNLEELLTEESSIIGATLYDLEGNVVDQFGEPPGLRPTAETIQNVVRHSTANNTRYDVAWPSASVGADYILVVRHDISAVRGKLWRYVARVAVLVVIISGFVTVVAFVGLEKILITPILHLRDDLRIAGNAVQQDQIPSFYTLSVKRGDELGEVTAAFRDMFFQIHEEIRQRKVVELALKREQAKADRLLSNMLPASIAQQLKQQDGAIADRIDEATILFADIVDFTGLAAQVPPLRLVEFLNRIFSRFDQLADHHKLEKIKTIGDAYMVVGGLTYPLENPARAVAEMALDMQDVIRQFKRKNGQPFQLRIGINTGPVVAGVIGLKKYSYDLWGDAVNIASRMESHGEVGKIQVSESTYTRIRGHYVLAPRGRISVKGRGHLKTYFLQGRKGDRPVQKAIAHYPRSDR